MEASYKSYQKASNSSWKMPARKSASYMCFSYILCVKFYLHFVIGIQITVGSLSYELLMK